MRTEYVRSTRGFATCLMAVVAPLVVAGMTALAAEDAPPVTVESLTFDAFQKKIAANTKAKYTMVDAWATWCGPCKENFPHVIDMNKKYGPKGLAVVSLSFDDPSEPKQIADARKFLNEKHATFTNVLLNEETGVGFEKLDINAIPAVFVYAPGGKLIRKFTMDDPNNQFTYGEVEVYVAALLDGKSPAEAEKLVKAASK
ncbi:MAG: redoxin domain-containing protein [Planctomycetota bacterium]|nr:redoxin domain-containing protein [Planctomycetota bacterium]